MAKQNTAASWVSRVINPGISHVEANVYLVAFSLAFCSLSTCNTKAKPLKRVLKCPKPISATCMRDPHFFLKSPSSSELTFFTIFCSSIRKALTILQNMDPCMQLSEGHHRHMGTFSCAMRDPDPDG